MKKISKILKMQAYSKNIAKVGQKIGFVPTMGYLHEGHLSLIRKSKSQCDITIVSIFVNPAQFGQNEDFSKYPRDMEKDLMFLRELKIDVVFLPASEEIYPDPFFTKVSVTEVTKIGEGVSRPTHFDGVTTVVTKLLNIVSPDVMYLGQKDIQQAVTLKKMVSDLNIPVNIRICPTIREKSGLAMSSRNVYLNKQEYKDALVLNTALASAKKLFTGGEISCEKIEQEVIQIFENFKGAKLDYILFADVETFKPVKMIINNTIIAIAGYVGKTRLIDNVMIKV